MNEKRLRESAERVGEIGSDPAGGITRLAFGREYYEAVDVLKEEMRAAGLQVRVDSVGNVIGLRPGRRKEQILMGSHLDTVKNGGLFDGNLGIAAALEVIRCLNDAGAGTEHTMAVAAFQAEEGGELGGTFGSRAALGMIDPESEAVKRGLEIYGLERSVLEQCRLPIEDIRYFLELHVEQGDYLYNRGLPLGLVSGIVGITRFCIIAEGESNHAGTTEMKGRKDALVAISRLICEIDRLAQAEENGLVATVGALNVQPNMANIIPGRVEAVLEVRHMEAGVIDRFMRRVREAAAREKKAAFRFETVVEKSSVACDGELLRCMEDCCREAGYAYAVMPSRAGHDANAVAKKIPTGMIFVPSREGKSHCPEEWTDWEDAARGAELLLKVVEKMDRADRADRADESRRSDRAE